MHPANITRAEAAERSAHVSTSSYEVELDLTGDAETFSSTSTVRYSCDGAATWIDLIAPQVVRAELDGVPLETGAFADSRIQLPATGPGEHVLVVEAVCDYSHAGEGLHRFVDPADDRVYLYSQFETADARRVYACFEQPDLKATFRLAATVPDGWVVVSNSANPTVTDAGEGKRWEFPPTPRVATYVTAVVAGEYHVEPGTIRSVKGEIPAALVCRQSVVEHLDSDRIRQTTQRGFEVYEENFGTPYAFDSYDQVFAPEYNMGAMENAGCVTLRDEYLFRSHVTSAQLEGRDSTILHELAHMWFGDLVTMRWWDDLWLNESFAEWGAAWCQEQIAARWGGPNPWVTFANARKGWAFRQDQLPTTHPVAADMVDLEAVEQNFDGITYAKGASVLKQLVAYVGQDAFLAGVRSYFAAHAYANSTFDDLLGALTAASGRDLSGFAADWLESAGMNTLRPELVVGEDGVVSGFAVLQSASEAHPRLRRHRMAIGCYDFDESCGKLVSTESVEVDLGGARTEVPALVGRKRPAIILLNDRDLTFAKVRLDPESARAAVEGIDAVDDALARAVIWTSAWDMWRDAELGSPAYLELVLRSLPLETDATAMQTRIDTAKQAVTAYCDPSLRPKLQARLATGLENLLRGAKPGSDLQLCLAKGLIDVASAPEDVTWIAGWLDGVGRPDGLKVDADRRWQIVKALARLGAADGARIEVELRRDPTITGQEQAAGARSGANDPSLKAEAWRLATDDPSVPNATLREICSNFWQYGQEDLAGDYAERYLDLVQAVSAQTGAWSGRGVWVANFALIGLWPHTVADAAYIANLDAWLASHPELTPAALRVLAENRDAALRALRAQAASLG
jgi:aminopeptidase N